MARPSKDAYGPVVEREFFLGDDLLTAGLKNLGAKFASDLAKLRPDIDARIGQVIAQPEPSKEDLNAVHHRQLAAYQALTIDHPYLPTAPPMLSPSTLPTTNSCRAILDGYRQWGTTQIDGPFELQHIPLEPVSASHNIATGHPLDLDARVVVGGGGQGFAVNGVSAWFRTGSSARASAQVQFILNAHDYVTTALVGTAEGRLSVGAAISTIQWLEFWNPVTHTFSVSTAGLTQVTEQRFTFGDLTYLGFERWDSESQTLTLSFNGGAGMFFRVDAWIEVIGTSFLAGFVGAEIAAHLNPVIICQ